MHMPCEVVSKIYFPVIRNVLAYELVVLRGYSQQDAAKELGITQAAVAQYLKNMRGNKKIEEIKSDRELMMEIKEFAININKLNRQEKMRRFCEMCKILRKNGHLEKYGFSAQELDALCKI